MLSTESNSIRNGVIATVVGGLALAVLGELWPAFKAGMVGAWDYLVAFLKLAGQSYQVPGWLFGLISFLALITTVRFLVGIKSKESSEPLHTRYVEDSLFGATWRWSWIAGQVSNLWCFCPNCKIELVYDDSAARDILQSLEPRTDFICERCNHKTVASIPGGGKSYALSAVKREITRRICVGEFRQKEDEGS